MRVVTLAPVLGLLALCAACASGFERNEDDDDGPGTTVDAPFGGGGDGSIATDARIVDAPGTVTDAAMQTDAPTTGGITCPDTIDYYVKALDEISNNPNWVDCASGADCSSAQCCYGQIVCVAYP